MTQASLTDAVRRYRATVSRYPLLAAGLALTMVVLAGGDYAEVIPILAPVVAWPYFPLFHALHDLLALLLALYVAYRLLPALGVSLILLYVAVHVPYFYLEFPQDLPEFLRIVAVGIVAVIGIRLIAKLQGLYTELGAKAGHLLFLKDLTGIMNSSLNMDEVYGTFVNRLRESVPVDRAAIVWSEGEQVRVFSLNMDMPPPEGGMPTGGGLIPREGTGLSWLIEHRVPRYQPDLAQEGQFTTDAEHRRTGLRSYLRLPLLFQGEVIGAFNLGSKKPDAYGAEERQFLEGLAAHITPAVAHARLYAEQMRRAEQMAVLHQVSQAVSQSLNLEAVAALALEATLKVLGLDGGAIRCVDDATQELPLLCDRGLPPEMVKERQARPPLRVGEGLVGRVAQLGEPLVVDDFSHDTRSIYESNSRSGFESYVGLPLKVGDRVVGVISGLSNRQRTFTPAELEMMSSIGNMVGMAIANARLFEQVEAAGQAWQQTFDSMSDGVSIHSTDFRILQANGALARMLGTTPEALVGQRCHEVFHGLGGPIAGCPLARCMADKRVYETERQEPRLGNRWLHVQAEPLLSPEGELLGVLHTVTDITERKKAEEELIQRTHELEAALQQLQATQEQLIQSDRLATVGQLASGVAHEVNNPLTAVLGYAQLLLGKNLDEAVRSDLEVISQEAQRAAGITRNLLSFARQHEPERSYISINEAVESTLALRAYQMRVSNIEVVAELQPDLPGTKADLHQLRQVFLNIVINAEQAMSAAHGGGRLQVKTWHSDQSIRIMFADDGPGIPKKNLSRVFDPFFTTKEVGKGSGLGLSICYGIVQEHGGSIRVESEEGKGATFTVEIPVGSEEAGPPVEG